MSRSGTDLIVWASPSFPGSMKMTSVASLFSPAGVERVGRDIAAIVSCVRSCRKLSLGNHECAGVQPDFNVTMHTDVIPGFIHSFSWTRHIAHPAREGPGYHEDAKTIYRRVYSL